MQKRTNLIILVICLLIAFGLGFGIGKSISLESKISENQLISDLEGKLESKIKKGLISFLEISYGEKRARTSLSGEVIKIEGNILTVKVPNHYRGGKFFDYLSEPDYYQKRIKTGQDTEIVKLTIKEISEIPSFPEETFMPFEEKEASLSDLKEGMKVFIEAESEFDLAGAKEILAKRIEIRE